MNKTMLRRAVQSKLHIKLFRDQSDPIAEALVERLMAMSTDELVRNFGCTDEFEVGEQAAKQYIQHCVK